MFNVALSKWEMDLFSLLMKHQRVVGAFTCANDSMR